MNEELINNNNDNNVQEKKQISEMPMRDTNVVVQRFKDFFENSLKKLVLDTLEFDWYDLNGKAITIDFKEFFKICDKKTQYRMYQEISKNAYGVLRHLYTELKIIKKELESNFKDIVREIDNMDQYLQNYELDIEELQQEINQKDKIIKDLKEELRQNDIKNVHQRVDTMHMMMMSLASGKPMPHQLFDEKVLENVAQENNIPKQELKKNFLTSNPISNIDEEQSSENIEDKNTEQKLSKKQRLQECHNKILEFIKQEEEGLLPLHKVNPDEASSYYKNAWDNIYFQFDLNETDLPDFINNLKEYANKPDDYLDILENIDKEVKEESKNMF